MMMIMLMELKQHYVEPGMGRAASRMMRRLADEVNNIV